MIEGALVDAELVVNVGAGAGSYESTDRRVVAVELSGIMLAQHPGPYRVRGEAEHLPFPDASFELPYRQDPYADPRAGLLGEVLSRRTPIREETIRVSRVERPGRRHLGKDSRGSPVPRNETVVVGEDDYGGSVADVELGEEVVDVGFDGAFADEELPGNLGIGVALPDEGKDVSFPAGELVERSGTDGGTGGCGAVDGQHPGGNGWVEPGAASGDRFDGPVELFGGDPFEYEAGGPGAEHAS